MLFNSKTSQISCQGHSVAIRPYLFFGVKREVTSGLLGYRSLFAFFFSCLCWETDYSLCHFLRCEGDGQDKAAEDGNHDRRGEADFKCGEEIRSEAERKDDLDDAQKEGGDSGDDSECESMSGKIASEAGKHAFHRQDERDDEGDREDESQNHKDERRNEIGKELPPDCGIGGEERIRQLIHEIRISKDSVTDAGRHAFGVHGDGREPEAIEREDEDTEET